jgi:two-component system sensor histidine kinase/response regulator
LTSMGNRRSDQLQEAGFSAGLVKPIRQSQLYDCIAGVMAPPPAEGKDVGTETAQLAPLDKPPGGKTHTSSAKALRILVVEDNAVNQKVAVRMLEKLGYTAEVAGNGVEAMQALSLIAYDIVFMDCHMPEMDGFEATAQIRTREGERKHTAIVAMTANALQGDREKCLAAGMDDYIAKPVNQA